MTNKYISHGEIIMTPYFDRAFGRKGSGADPLYESCERLIGAVGQAGWSSSLSTIGHL